MDDGDMDDAYTAEDCDRDRKVAVGALIRVALYRVHNPQFDRDASRLLRDAADLWDGGVA